MSGRECEEHRCNAFARGCLTSHDLARAGWTYASGGVVTQVHAGQPIGGEPVPGACPVKRERHPCKCPINNHCLSPTTKAGASPNFSGVGTDVGGTVKKNWGGSPVPFATAIPFTRWLSCFHLQLSGLIRAPSHPILCPLRFHTYLSVVSGVVRTLCAWLGSLAAGDAQISSTQRHSAHVFRPFFPRRGAI